ncbi:MAG: dynamin family protein [Thermodesulfobacteriota bacterium]
MRLLSPQQEDLLKNERRILNDLQLTLAELGVEKEDQEALRQSVQQLDEFFLIVVVGEFNSGKSAVINALLGQRLLEEGVIPTTTQIYILRYGENQQRSVVGERQVLLTFPVDFLSELSIVDTPGTNAVIREHETITSHFIPRSDLVLFITSADRPFTESERIFLEQIREWGKKIVFVLNKIDLLNNEDDRSQIEDFVLKNAHLLLKEKPEIYSVSAREALRAKLEDPGLWEKSRFGLLETYIRETLDRGNRFRLKCLNPLGVGIHLAEKSLEKISSRLQFLQRDLNLLDDVDAQLNLYKEDMQNHFGSRMAEVENLLYEMENRGQVFFDETFRLGRVFDLLSKAHIQQEFERQVVADTPHRIESKVSEIIHWLVDSDLQQWQAVTRHLSDRTREHQGSLLGEMGMDRFYRDRQSLLDTIVRDTRRVVETYDKSREAKTIAESAQTAVAASAALEASAVGLGALVTTLATTAAADVTGVLMASLMAAVGLFVIPAKRRRGKAKMMKKIASLRTQLTHSLRTHFEKEINRNRQHLHEAIAPYTRFVRSERARITKYQSEIEHLRGEMLGLREKFVPA